MTYYKLALLLFILPCVLLHAENDNEIAAPALSDSIFKASFTKVENDQRRIWSFPKKLAEPKVVIAAGAVVGVTAAVIAFDPQISTCFRRTKSFTEFNRIFNSNLTGYATLATPAVLLTVGLLHNDPKMTAASIEAGETMADAEILAIVLKDITRRDSPAATQSGWFKASGSSFLGNGSFPSGHTISAFAVATVVARRYSNHRWVPWAAYGLAGAIGFSRVTSSAHFLSDVIAGGALGYSIGRLGSPTFQ